MSKMPTVFIPHGGGPCFFMEWDPPSEWDRMAGYLKNLKSDIRRRPTAIVLVSAHWEEDVITVQSTAAPSLLFDYYGFPPHTYELEYPAPGAPELAARIAALIGGRGLAVAMDDRRDFDHGVFIPLKLAFAQADIPVVQVSLRGDLDPAAHIELGKALAPLREDDVLIIGSGMSFHNMRVLMSARGRGKSTLPQMDAFNQWLRVAATNPDPAKRNTLLAAWASAPGARFAHPREEHLMPLHVVAGAAGTDTGRETLSDIVLGSPQSAFQFG